jgi:hypothetical protein
VGKERTTPLDFLPWCGSGSGLFNLNNYFSAHLRLVVRLGRTSLLDFL